MLSILSSISNSQHNYIHCQFNQGLINRLQLTQFRQPSDRFVRRNPILPVKFGRTELPLTDPKDPAKVINVEPGSFDINVHYYREPQQSDLHPTVAKFTRMGLDKIVARYAQTHPGINEKLLNELLHYKPRYFYWAGGDLFPVKDFRGVNQMVLLETNSCPSGQKSRPSGGYGSYEKLLDDADKGGYEVVGKAFVNAMKQHSFADTKSNGRVVVLYDKNYKETTGYAATLADLLDEDVLLVPLYRDSPDNARWTEDGTLEVKDESGQWVTARAVYRYVTQAPWERLPIKSRTMIFNPPLACLAGGRNKGMAFIAYQMLNDELGKQDAGFGINMPKTFSNINLEDVPEKVKELGGLAVVKIPYSNAGQGVFILSSQKELDEFIASQKDNNYQKYIVQELLGHANWIPEPSETARFHRGSTNGSQRDPHPRVFDMRMMVTRGENGWQFVTANGRFAKKPFTGDINAHSVSDVLKTNLSVKQKSNRFDSDSSRLIPIHDQGFNRMALSLDDLIEGFIQTTLSAVAIDRLAQRLVHEDGSLNVEKFNQLNGQDDSLLAEIQQGSSPTEGAFILN